MHQTDRESSHISAGRERGGGWVQIWGERRESTRGGAEGHTSLVEDGGGWASRARVVVMRGEGGRVREGVERNER